ncbi:MAG: hypothetical protein JXA53_05660 [Bacteroidales bacterium]|nr:hypothetical protein [Bacteroidales bacterium]
MESYSDVWKKVNLSKSIMLAMSESGITMTSLSSKLGVYPSTVKYIMEKNRASLPRLVQMSKALNFNFFKLYANALEINEPVDFMVAQRDNEIESLKAEIENLKQQIMKKDVEIDVLHKVVGMKAE